MVVHMRMITQSKIKNRNNIISLLYLFFLIFQADKYGKLYGTYRMV